MPQPNNLALLPKSVILRRKSDIQAVYENGIYALSFPVKANILLSTYCGKGEYCKVIFSVSKKYQKHAVDRNLLRRRIKEAFRLQKNELESLLSEHNLSVKMAISYVSKDISNYTILENGVAKIIEKVSDMAICSAH